MRKRTIIFLVLLLLLLAGASVYGFFLLFRDSGDHAAGNSTYRAVPVDAVLVQHFSGLNTLTGEVLTPGSYLESLFHPEQETQAFLAELTAFLTAAYPGMAQAETLCSLHPSAKIPWRPFSAYQVKKRRIRNGGIIFWERASYPSKPGHITDKPYTRQEEKSRTIVFMLPVSMTC